MPSSCSYVTYINTNTNLNHFNFLWVFLVVLLNYALKSTNDPTKTLPHPELLEFSRVSICDWKLFKYFKCITHQHGFCINLRFQLQKNTSLLQIYNVAFCKWLIYLLILMILYALKMPSTELWKKASAIRTRCIDIYLKSIPKLYTHS